MGDFVRQPPRRNPAAKWIPALLLVALFGLYFLTSGSASSMAGWKEDFGTALSESEMTGRPMLVAFVSRGCPPCTLMDRTVFSEPIVQQALESFIPVRLDITRQPEVAAQFSVEGTPTYTVVDTKNKTISQITGAVPVEGFLRFLKDARKPAEPSAETPVEGMTDPKPTEP